MNKLGNILKVLEISVDQSCEDIALSYLSSNTQDLSENTLFIALKGLSFDARKVDIAELISKGVVAVIYDDCDDFVMNSESIPCIPCKDLDYKQAIIAKAFYDNQTSKIELIGVTGTNGKSTITHIVSQWLHFLGEKTAVMGTLGTGIYPNLIPSANTTMKALDLEKRINQFIENGVESIAMEVSSHGVVQRRITGLTFSIAAFTNLSRDHLDFHKTMENYATAKLDFLKMVNPRNCVLNVGDKTGLEFYQNYLTEALCYSREKCEEVNNLIYAENVIYTKSGVEFDVNGKYGKAHFCSKLLGSFNIENLLCAISILLLKGYTLEQLSKYSNELSPICGRMECFKGVKTPLSVVDYAHTPDGLEKALQALKEHSFGRIITVVGCGGDRDTGKRPNMAKIACQNSDYVIFTTDNPRTEQPENILKMMVDGVVSNYQNYEQVIDRKQAIVKAYNNATKEDVILVAGKGHEDYQIIGKTKHHFSDREIVSELCGL